MRTYNIGCEVSLIAYNGRSSRKAVRESIVTGPVVKVTKDYVHVLSYADGRIWKAPRNQD